MPSGGVRKGAGRPKGGGKYTEQTKAIRLPLSVIKALDEQNLLQPLPLYLSKVSAGLPLPADDVNVQQLNLHQYLIKNPAMTFAVRANGESMLSAGIHDNDILIIDRSLPTKHGKIVIAAVNGHLTVKRLLKNSDGSITLAAENPAFPSIEIQEDNEVLVLGVVTYVIHQV